MPTMIFVNLPVRELAASIRFYEALGGSRNPQCSDDTAACIVLSDAIHVMLLTHDKFMQFSPRPVADARATARVLLCVSAESREAVDGQVRKAMEAGGTPDPTPTQDYGFMYGRSYEDPDGHIWEVMWMDPAAAASGTAAA
ncbi:lactoylglutathione lyase [Aureimonas flava]|uniref:Lactoylglutathione lyase n=1 Tax=Aureimonas flava TaxID=2320271 RepID=A0A3A1WGP7_9HYPH|nr:VOC family protein [Aureimonas flava]RIX98768.1 lactoylglutathione lyase [Aureimonas flava]